MKAWGRLLVVALVPLVVPVLPAAAVDPATTVSISGSSSYVAGATAHIDVKVAGTGPGYALKVTLTRANGTQRVDATDVGDETVSFSYAMYVNSKVKAEVYDGSHSNVVATASRSFSVHASVSTVPRGGYLGYSGYYAVFPTGASPYFRSKTTPARPGVRCLKHQVQTRYSSGWRTSVISSCKVEDSAGRVEWQWAGKHSSKVHFRVRAVFTGDAWNTARNAPWCYFTFK